VNATTVPLRNERTVLGCPHCGGNDGALTPGGIACIAGRGIPAEPLRPHGHGLGLDGPTCPERVRAQFPHTGDYRTRLCVRCGRITARLDRDGAGWCGGVLETAEPLACRTCRTPMNPALAGIGTHPECQPRPARHLQAVAA
jgi:hypothetical protein